MFRHWRIQVALICFALLLAVIVFWVRSYSWADVMILTFKSRSCLDVSSVLGKVLIIHKGYPAGSLGQNLDWQMDSRQLTKDMKDAVYSFQKDHYTNFLGFDALFESSYIVIGVPYWFI